MPESDRGRSPTISFPGSLRRNVAQREIDSTRYNQQLTADHRQLTNT
jgi:hypothetical protein